MLQATAIPAAPSAPMPWAHLDVPHRIARVLDIARLVGGNDCVTREDFLRAPETCDLTATEIEANIGEAQRILIEGRVEPTYPREVRLKHALKALLPTLPSAADMLDRLALHHFQPSEIATLWPDLMRRLAMRFDADRAPLPDGIAADIPNWGRQMLEANAN